MTDLEKAEKWLGISARSVVRNALDAVSTTQPQDPEDAVRIACEAVLLDLYSRRIRMTPQQRNTEKKRLKAKSAR